MKPVDVRDENFAELQGRLTGQRLAVYEGYCHYGPCTTDALAATMGMSVLSVRPRTTELYQLGLVRMTGRTGHDGIYQAVSVAKAEGGMRKAEYGEQLLFGV